VEDYESTSETLARILTARGHKVIAADGASQARELAQSFNYDLIVSDFCLPDGDGGVLLSELRQRKPGCQGIILSGMGMAACATPSRGASFDLILTKPIDVRSLDDAIRQLAQMLTASPPTTGVV
jgi:OmpR-family two-component system manganese-sensing response regulator